MIPIAKKTFGLDEATGLQKELHVWGQFNDARNETITVYYDILLISSTGIPVSTINSSSYIRTGSKFTALRSSELGQGITALIEGDMNMIQSYETISTDLQQTSL